MVYIASPIIRMVIMGLLFCIFSNNTAFENYESKDKFICYLDYLDCINEERSFHPDLFQDEFLNMPKQNFTTISLGCNCAIGIYTRMYNIRTFAFPFDWCMTPYETLYNFLDTSFKDFFKKENLISSTKTYFPPHLQSFFDRLNYTEVSEHPTWVLDKQFGIVFNHDFSDNSMDTINKEYEQQFIKYSRRIKRFYTEVNSGKHIYFIRHFDITKQQALQLYKLLKEKFPKAPFTLIVIGTNAKEFGKSWNIPHIKNYLIQAEPFWQNLCYDIASGLLK